MNFDDRTLRDALGRFATGVCVITTIGKDVPAFGMTVNSFSSLSLDPPLVLWSIGKCSDCFYRFSQVERYVVNVLRETQKGLSNRFASREGHDLAAEEWQPGENGLPVLTDPLAVFECDIAQRIDAGDHVILVGKVTLCQHQDGNPLLFFGGQYGAIQQ